MYFPHFGVIINQSRRNSSTVAAIASCWNRFAIAAILVVRACACVQQSEKNTRGGTNLRSPPIAPTRLRASTPALKHLVTPDTTYQIRTSS